jgi:hypothetical protein
VISALGIDYGRITGDLEVIYLGEKRANRTSRVIVRNLSGRCQTRSDPPRRERGTQKGAALGATGVLDWDGNTGVAFECVPGSRRPNQKTHPPAEFLSAK